MHSWPGWGIDSYLYSQQRIQNLGWPAEQEDFQVLSRPLPYCLPRFPIPHISSSSSFMDNNYFGRHSVRCQGVLFFFPQRDSCDGVGGRVGGGGGARKLRVCKLFGFSFLFFLIRSTSESGRSGLLLVVWKSRLRTVDLAAEIRIRARSAHEVLAFSSSVYYSLFNLVIG